MSDPIEVTTKYVTTVDSLPAAWEFVMARLDCLGPRPTIEIRPVSSRLVRPGVDEDDWTEPFSVTVSAMTETHPREDA